MRASWLIRALTRVGWWCPVHWRPTVLTRCEHCRPHVKIVYRKSPRTIAERRKKLHGDDAS